MRSSLDKRLVALESVQPAIKAISEDDPRVVAYRAKAHQRLSEMVLEATSGIETHERLSPPERVVYFQELLDEAEYAIANHGKTPFDDIQSSLMSGPTLRIMQELNYEVACENIEELRENLALAKEAAGKCPKRRAARSNRT